MRDAPRQVVLIVAFVLFVFLPVYMALVLYFLSSGILEPGRLRGIVFAIAVDRGTYVGYLQVLMLSLGAGLAAADTAKQRTSIATWVAVLLAATGFIACLFQYIDLGNSSSDVYSKVSGIPTAGLPIAPDTNLVLEYRGLMRQMWEGLASFIAVVVGIQLSK